MTEHEDGPEGLAALPGLARIALSAGWRTGEWAARTAVAVPRRALALARHPENALDLARELLGAVPAGSDRVRGPAPGGAESGNGRPDDARRAVETTLREEGELLLRRSRDVHYEVEAHPAYERILSELAPDEGRILRLLLLDGPQPTVDVRTGGPVGIVRSRLIAPGSSMIGARAGCRYVDRVPSYLNNLFRLGLIWFSRETLRDPLRYQVLEAQPDVLEAIHSVRQAKVVRRSIHLTPFGEDFCRVCLSSEGAALDGLPRHSPPPPGPQPPAESSITTPPPA
jgi:Abortive infection alpha